MFERENSRDSRIQFRCYSARDDGLFCVSSFNSHDAIFFPLDSSRPWAIVSSLVGASFVLDLVAINHSNKSWVPFCE